MSISHIALIVDMVHPTRDRTSDHRMQSRNSCPGISVCRAQVFTGFFGRGNSIHNMIPLLKIENIHLRIICLKKYVLEAIIAYKVLLCVIWNCVQTNDYH